MMAKSVHRMLKRTFLSADALQVQSFSFAIAINLSIHNEAFAFIGKAPLIYFPNFYFHRKNI
jgi:hypothetical protein